MGCLLVQQKPQKPRDLEFLSLQQIIAKRPRTLNQTTVSDRYVKRRFRVHACEWLDFVKKSNADDLHVNPRIMVKGINELFAFK